MSKLQAPEILRDFRPKVSERWNPSWEAGLLTCVPGDMPLEREAAL